ncbi:TetR/AcrR family transcriptional regulator [Albimonas sp. CAU 1670]|uniref:TetR/AcrR family transcriptional regulator n=1 Tax=Albimonas sp. CAU 1670 TaxID=3032599 RepID=UPI0023DB89B5|nr:TetR/AcrR family transcriptional regulator [Albimonas sp. CAU 1670]MDF2235088.1 TetR/AcrR family transcriptional regulator [Albimonas sp. CAU 1670]
MDQSSPMRERILQAAEDMLVEYGMQSSMARIAAKAGVAAGSIYNHFESKEELIRAVYDRVADVLGGQLIEADAPEAPPVERLERYVDAYVDLFWETPSRAILFEYLSSVPLIPEAELIRAFRRPTEHVEGIFGDLEAAGLLRPGERSMMGGFIGGAIRNTLKWRRMSGRPLTGEDRAQIRRMCLDAVLKPA